MDALSPYLLAWRTVALRDREVVDAIVHPAHAGPSADLAREIERWPGPRYWSDEDGLRHLVLIRPTPVRRRERWALHGLLLGLTVVTTLFSGAVFAGALPAFRLGLPSWEEVRQAPAGWSYALPLLAILLAHELGHYLTARRYAVDVSPPYFLPWPSLPFVIGTLGAFIRLRAPIADRRQLIDIGSAGPFAGFAVAAPLLAVGLWLSRSSGEGGGPAALILAFDQHTFVVGHSLVTAALTELVHPGADSLRLHPTAFAGWLGVFVTMLNLIPLGQLDGGHLLYGASPRAQRLLTRPLWIILLAMGLLWVGWALWAILILVVGRGRMGQSLVVDEYRRVPPNRRAVALASLALFIVTFTPVPWVSLLIA